ncbi:MAG: acyl-CoA dehydrogenase, partial [Actinobacteria bacterium]|nr:acyl-CoA dehydrogenase [Actinomycetota bacterium]
MSYAPPIDDMRFTLEAVAGIDRLRAIGTEAVDAETIGQILDEAGKLARDRIAPLNATGDRVGSRLDNGVVRTPPGWQDAYRAFVDG